MKVVLRIILLISSVMFLYTSCEKDPASPKSVETDPDEIRNYSMGWLATKEDVESVPYAPFFGFGSDNLRTRHDLTEFFPSIGEQAGYGTWAPWAVGSNVMTAISAMHRDVSPYDLADSVSSFRTKASFI